MTENTEESPVVQDAIDIMARYALWRITDPEKVLWEDYPELGEYDFGRLLVAVERLVPECPDLHERQDAYEFLKGRADRG